MSFPSLRSDRPVSLWTRIVALISLLLILGTTLTGGLSLFLLNRTLIQSVDNNLTDGTGELPDFAERDLEKDPMDADELSPVEYIVEVRYRDGSPPVRIDHTDQERPVDVQFPDLTENEIIERGGEPFTVIDGSEGRWRVRAMPDERPDGGGAVFVALPLDDVDRTMHEMALIIVLVGTGVVLMGMGCGGYIAHRALEPLRDVEATAAQIAAGDLTRRVPETQTSMEVHRLSRSVNEMLVHIEQAFAAQSDSEARATASEARMRRFVGDASHELRTPLAAIRGFGELYRMGALGTEESVSQSMRRIEDEARRMGSLVENLLRLARLDEKPSLDLEPLDITDALFDAAQDLRALDPSRQVMVTSLSGTALSVSPHIPVGVLGHEPSLRQVILNLVGNANRHTPKGSPVELAVGALEDGRTLLEVRDHGEGIDEEQRDKIFERFYRTDESRQRSASQGGGAGLGLAIAESIVQQHRGEISVVETPGGGATFRVELHSADLDEHGTVSPDQTRSVTDQR